MKLLGVALDAVMELRLVLQQLRQHHKWLHYEITLFNGDSDEEIATYDSRKRGKDYWEIHES